MKLINSLLKTSFDFEKDIGNTYIKKFIFIFTELGSSFGAGIILVGIALISGYQALFAFVPIYLAQLLITEGIKFLYKIPRPKAIFKNNLWGMKLSSGAFPSGHTSNIFTLATLMTIYYKYNIPTTIFVFGIAGSVAITRIFLGRHYLADVIGGAILGILMSIIGSYALIMILPLVI